MDRWTEANSRTKDASISMNEGGLENTGIKILEEKRLLFKELLGKMILSRQNQEKDNGIHVLLGHFLGIPLTDSYMNAI